MRRWLVPVAIAVVVILAGGTIALRAAPAQPSVRTIVLGGYPIGVVADDPAGLVLVFDGASLHAIDAHSGAVRYVTTSVGAFLAIDRRAQRVLFNSCCAAGGTRLDLTLADARSGRIVSRRSLPAGSIRAAVDQYTGRAFILYTNGVTSSGQVMVLDTRDGRLLRRQKVGLFPDSIGVDERSGHVFVTAFVPNWYAYMLDARDGRLLRRVWLDSAAGAAPGAIIVDARMSHAFVITPANTSVSVLDTRTGQRVRTTTAGTGPLTMAADSVTGRLFVSSATDGVVRVLDARTGRLLRSILVGRQPGMPVVSLRGGRVFVADTGSDTVSVLDAHNGTLIRTVPVGANPDSIAVDDRSGRAYVVARGASDRAGNPASGGRVSVLDAHSGRVLRSVSVGINPNGIVVDEPAGRVFVVNGGGSMPLPDRWGWVPAWLRQRVPALASRQPSSCLIFTPNGPPTPSASCRTEPGSVSVFDALN